MSEEDNTPIIVGAAQQVWRDTDVVRTPVDALHEVSAAALADATDKIAATIDAIVHVRFIADSDAGSKALFPRNPGRQLADRLGLKQPGQFQGIIGGNSPQYLVNHCAQRLARGDRKAVLITGAELLASFFAALSSGADLSAWPGPADEAPTTIGVERDGLNEAEQRHGLYEPINTYPLFENSLRSHLGVSAQQHQQDIAQLCSDMSRVAADNPFAWRPQFLTAEQIGQVSDKNRYIGYPYTKAMNAVLAVNMGAALVMTTVTTAKQVGIDPSQWIYLRGGVDVNDLWYLSERPVLHESPAIRNAWQALSQHTGIELAELDCFDLYSCFPSAIEVACREIGLSVQDDRGVTVTGGLPYFGGPGNNYSLHAIAEMVKRLRTGVAQHGLVTANGLYLTKHSLGVYSSQAPQTAWQPLDSAPIQHTVDVGPKVKVAADPSGKAKVETYTVCFGREGPKQGIVIARNAAGERIIANTATDEQILQQWLNEDPIGHTGFVRIHDNTNYFEM